MTMDISQVPILIRREIEARLAGPLVEALSREFGRDQVLAVLGEVMENLAYQSGQELAEKMGGNTLADFAKGLEAWQAGGAYDVEVLELNDDHYHYNITRCSYAAMYESLNLRELGCSLSCRRDFKLVEGFNPNLRLTRTKTLMEGADCCDFRISKLS